MDMNIPTIDGWEAARQIRLDPESAGIPLIAFSGRVDCVADIRDDDGRFDGFIAKPVSPTDLVRRVRAYVELVEAHAPIR
jgi:CheY-like chemotaxis protein